MKISVVIVNYKVPNYIHQCLLSIEKAAAMFDTEIFVVDNASEDQSVEMIRKFHPQVICIENEDNVGFSKANNIAMRKAKGEYLLIINPDTFVSENMIEDCVRFMDQHPEVGATGVSMYDSAGKFAPESRRAVPRPVTAFYKLIGLCKRFPKSRRFGKYYLGYLDRNKPSEIEILSGACMFMRRSAIEKVGFFDEDYFMYGEDIDLSYRILKAGYKNYYLPVEIIHYKGESTHKNSFTYVNNFNMSMIIFLKKHFTFYSWIFELPIISAVYLKAAIGYVRVSFKKIFCREKPIEEQRKLDRFLVLTDDENHDPAIELLKNRGLLYDTLKIDPLVKKEGHRVCSQNLSKYEFVVYNTTDFDYKDIIHYFKDSEDARPKMAIYHHDIDKIITPYYILENQ